MIFDLISYNCIGVTSVRTNLADLIFSLKKNEACLLKSCIKDPISLRQIKCNDFSILHKNVIYIHTPKLKCEEDNAWRWLDEVGNITTPLA